MRASAKMDIQALLWVLARKLYLMQRCACYLVQTGQETDFILVSCSGAGVSTESREKVLRAKQVFSILINVTKNAADAVSFYRMGEPWQNDLR